MAFDLRAVRGLGPLCAGASLTGLQWWEAEVGHMGALMGTV